MTNTNVTHDPQRVLADLRAALEECKRERDRLQAALRWARARLQAHHEVNYSLPWGGVCPICVPDGGTLSIFDIIDAALQPEHKP